ncbi:monocarboxylate transporter [Xylariales sp. PMI_506]|nr:monocarboxylate transporter [Xylariales sp. PMI_506]
MAEAVELRTITSVPQQPDDMNDDANNPIQSLPPTDSGADAWKFLFGSFMIEAVLWGFQLTFGVFQDYYTQLPEFEGNSNIAIIGTVSTSINFLGAPFVTHLVKRYQRWQRHMVVLGTSMCIISLVTASFMDTVPALIATQGVLYGLGFAILYSPVLRMLDEWFVRRRGLAYGILFAGGGFSGAGLPFALQALLTRYGYRVTLRAFAIAQFALVAPVLPLIKSRLPPSSHSALRRIDIGFLSQPLFYCFALSNLFQGLGYYIPSLYLPSYASAIGLSSTMGASILAINNVSTVVGQVAFGFISDRTQNVLLLVCASSLVSSIATLTLWGFASSATLLIVFALIFGLFGGAFVVLWNKFGTYLSEDPQPVYSLMSFGKGIGSMVVGPISARLLDAQITSGYGMGRFKLLIIFLGATMFCSSLGILGWPLKQPMRR